MGGPVNLPFIYYDPTVDLTAIVLGHAAGGDEPSIRAIADTLAQALAAQLGLQPGEDLGSIVLLPDTGTLAREVGNRFSELVHARQALLNRLLEAPPEQREDILSDAPDLVDRWLVALASEIGKRDEEGARSAASFDVAVTVARRIDAQDLLISTLEAQGTRQADDGYFEAAVDSHMAAADANAAAGEVWQQAWCLSRVGLHYQDLGRLEQAVDTFSNSASLFEAAGDIRGRALQLSTVGQIEVDRGEPSTGLVALDAAARDARKSGSDDVLGQVEAWRSVALARIGRVAEAGDALDAALAASERTGATGRIWWALNFAGKELVLAGDSHRYAELLSTAVEAAETQNRWVDVADGADQSARLALQQGNAGGVDEWVARFLIAAEALGTAPEGADPTDQRNVALSLFTLADLIAAHARKDTAVRLFRAARQLYLACGETRDAATPLLRIATLAMLEGNMAAAQQEASAAAEELRAAGDPDGARSAEFVAAKAMAGGVEPLEAAASFDSMATAALNEGRRQDAAVARIEQGQQLRRAGAHTAAATSFAAAAELFVAPTTQAAAVFEAAASMQEAGDDEGAASALGEAAKLAAAAGDAELEMLAAAMLGLRLDRRGLAAEAAGWLARAAELCTAPSTVKPMGAVGDGEVAVFVHMNRTAITAEVLQALIRNQIVLGGDVGPQIEAALGMEYDNSAVRLGLVLTAAIYMARRGGDLDHALQLLEGAARLADDALPQRRLVVSALKTGVLLQVGRLTEALAEARAALSLAEGLDDPEVVAFAAREAAMASRALGDLDEAQRLVMQAENAARDSGNRMLLAEVLGAATLVALSNADWQRALDESADALALAVQEDDPSLEGRILGNRANVLVQLGRLQDAVDLLERARVAAETTGDPLSLAATVGDLARTRWELGQTEEAIKGATAALAAHRAAGAERQAPIDLLNLGAIYLSIGETASAEPFLAEALAAAKQLGLPDIEVSAALNLAAVRIESDPADVVTTIDGLLSRGDDVLTSSLRFRALANRAVARRLLGNLQGAHDDAADAIELLEQERASLVLTSHRISLTGRDAGIVQDLLVATAAEQGDAAGAMAAAERAKANGLVRRLGRLPLAAPASVSPELAASESALIAELRGLDMDLDAAPNAGLRRQLEARASDVDRKLAAVLEHIEAVAPERAALRRGAIDPMAAVATLTNGGAAFISLYQLDDEIVVTGAGGSAGAAPVLHRASVSRSAVAMLVRDPAGVGTANLMGRVLAPVAQALAPFTRCFVAAHSELHRLPVAAATVDGEPLISMAPVLAVPSATAAAAGTVRPPSRAVDLLVAGYTARGDERDMFEGEALEVADVIGADALLGPAVTRQAVITTLRSARVVHLSCHGHFDSTDALASGLALSGGMLVARDLLAVPVDADLVTLSACDTAVTLDQGLDERVGLTQVLLAAGARATITSLWPVPADPTRRLMVDLYRQWTGDVDLANAFQRAVLALRRERSDPLVWAGFVLTGTAASIRQA